MAFLSQGHLPGEGKYSEQMQLSLDYIVSCQKRSGVLALAAPNREKISRVIDHETGYTLVYNHALAGLVLSECYAMVGAAQTEQIKVAIEKALDVTFQMQDFRRARQVDAGGWRYLDIAEFPDADLSVTAWQLMFMRSAKNAGFDVAEKRIDRAVKYVHRCFLKNRGTFSYKAGFGNRASRGMAGAEFWRWLTLGNMTQKNHCWRVIGFSRAVSKATTISAECETLFIRVIVITMAY